MLKAILFDFDQTVVNSAGGFRRAEHWLQREIHARLSGVEWEAFIGLYRQIRDMRRNDEAPAGKVQQWQEVCRRFEIEPDTATVEAWETGYWQRVEEGTAALPGAVELLDRLRARFALGLVTNAATIGKRTLRCEHFPELLDRFDAVVVCGENGLPLKPDPAGFHRALAILRAEPQEALFVGDNWATDILGARAAGIQPVWLRHAAIPRKSPGPIPDDTPLIDSFRPLEQLQPDDSLEKIRATLQTASCSRGS
jgi:HAD superfamily hydrolase (TIGR01509 family)